MYQSQNFPIELNHHHLLQKQLKNLDGLRTNLKLLNKMILSSKHLDLVL
jgi:hypothetical protein